jgi:hypothetical protein
LAKLKPSIFKISGKHGEDVHVDSKRYPRHLRKPVSPGTKRNEPAFKEQYTRTKYLNQLASEVNSIIEHNSDNLKPSTFYEELQRRFRKEALNNRLLLLLELRGMEVHPAYPLSKLGTRLVHVRISKNKIVVNLQVTHHPPAGKDKADCYDYQVLMVTWGKRLEYEEQCSNWVFIESGRPEFDFEFKRKADTRHWLFCLRLRLGIKEKPIEKLATTGMQIIDAGSFVKKDLEILEKRKKEQKTVKVAAIEKTEAEEAKRVKPKRML